MFIIFVCIRKEGRMIQNLKRNSGRRVFVDVEKDRRTFIKKLIKVYELLHPSEESKLKKSERNFLAECIFLETEKGVDIGSTAARKHLEEFFDIETKSIYTLRRDLKKKGWLRQDDYGYHYPNGLNKTELRLELKLGT